MWLKKQLIQSTLYLGSDSFLFGYLLMFTFSISLKFKYFVFFSKMKKLI